MCTHEPPLLWHSRGGCLRIARKVQQSLTFYCAAHVEGAGVYNMRGPLIQRQEEAYGDDWEEWQLRSISIEL